MSSPTTMINRCEDFRAAILRELSYAPDVIEPGKLHRFPTRDRYGDDAGYCKLFDDLRCGFFGDFRSGNFTIWPPKNRARMTNAERAALARQVNQARRERDAAQSQQWQVNAERIACLWSQCQPLRTGDAVTLYLQRRGLGDVSPRPSCLRMHPAMSYWHGGGELGRFPTMVAQLTAPDGRVVALHRTYLTADGRKADVPTVKKLTPSAGPLAGACIRLFYQEVGRAGIAEGIETALAACCAFGVPTVAAYSAGSLAAWQWPDELLSLVIFADADSVGAEAAAKLRQRACAAGVAVNVATPTTAGADWCDVWAQHDAAPTKGASTI